MNLWTELRSRREWPGRLMSTGSAFVIVGFGFLAWGLVMSDGDPWPGLSVSFIVVGAIVALVGYAMARWGGSSRRDSSSA